MGLKEFSMNNDLRMKIINFLKIYGYYGGILVNNEFEKKYIYGQLKLEDIIKNKKDYKELKASIKVVLQYCSDNYMKEMGELFNYFYKVECLLLKNKYGTFFDKF